MGAQAKSQSNAAFGHGDEEDVLQAVVIADSFNERFMPLTLDRPRCLLPLLNVPIIEYTFEFLAISGVQEVILLCRAHADQIRHYIARSRWAKPTSTMHIQIVVAPESMSVGDGLREVDARGLIHGDFILVSGDVVSNMDLGRALEVHRKTRQADKNVIMTMVLKRASPFHRSRERCEGAVFVIDGQTRECLGYEPVDSEERTRRVRLDAARLAGHPEVSIRYDLMDCQIDICSLNVLALFTENFDYQDMRKDFVRGVLQSDILGLRISTHILREEYAARVRTPRLYGSISRDLIARWMFPIVPESNLLEEERPLSFKRGYQYIGPDVVFSRSAQIGEYCVLGASVTVGENARLSHSVLGACCQVGPDVVLDGVFLGEGCLVEAGCRIAHSILADNVLVKAGSVIEAGCLITSNVTVGPKAHLPAHTRVAKLTEHVDVALNSFSIGSDPSDPGLLGDAATVPAGAQSTYERLRMLGRDSDGVVWEGVTDPVDEEEALGELEAEDEAVRLERKAAFALDDANSHYSPPSFLRNDSVEPSDSEDDEDEDGEHAHDDDDGYLGLDEDPSGDAASIHSTEHQGRSKQFVREALELVLHAIDSTFSPADSIDNAALEVNGLKFACNASFQDCQLAILAALFSRTESGAALATSLPKLWGRWSPLLAKFTLGHEEQLGLIAMICNLCKTHSNNPGEDRPFERAFNIAIPILYKTDVLDDSAITAWYEAESQAAGPDSLYCRQIRAFVTWLQADESDEDESDETDEYGSSASSDSE
jgi:translation initiation factor eIF-2B subunit epsilon